MPETVTPFRVARAMLSPQNSAEKVTGAYAGAWLDCTHWLPPTTEVGAGAEPLSGFATVSGSLRHWAVRCVADAVVLKNAERIAAARGANRRARADETAAFSRIGEGWGVLIFTLSPFGWI